MGRGTGKHVEGNLAALAAIGVLCVVALAGYPMLAFVVGALGWAFIKLELAVSARRKQGRSE